MSLILLRMRWPWAKSECDESPGLAGQPFIFFRVDGGSFRHGPRFEQPLNDEAGGEDFLAGGFQRRQPVPHPPALAPGLLNGPHIEVAAAVTEPVPGRMLPR